MMKSFENFKVEETPSPKIDPKRNKQVRDQKKLIANIQRLIFQHTGNYDNFTKHDVELSEGEISTTYFIKGNSQQDITFYMGHGFGGSALMFFHTFNSYLTKGNIVLWEVRGMGIGIKNKYESIKDDQINDFYVDGLKKIIDFYNHKKIVLISHSLSGYMTLRYMMEYPKDDRISKAVLLSPIGITSKERDQKNKITSFSLFVNALVNSFGWKFRLTFKSPLRTVLSCLKTRILKKTFASFSLTQSELSIMIELFETLIKLPDGSQNIFFEYFLPRVLPRPGESIEELICHSDIQKRVSIYYGSDEDWVDKKGAERIAKQKDNFTVHSFRTGGHMVCLDPEQMKHIMEIQFK